MERYENVLSNGVVETTGMESLSSFLSDKSDYYRNWRVWVAVVDKNYHKKDADSDIRVVAFAFDERSIHNAFIDEIIDTKRVEIMEPYAKTLMNSITDRREIFGVNYNIADDGDVEVYLPFGVYGTTYASDGCDGSYALFLIWNYLESKFEWVDSNKCKII